MALIKCTRCGSMVSDRAEACPRCGTELDEIMVDSIVQSVDHNVILIENYICPFCGGSFDWDHGECKSCDELDGYKENYGNNLKLITITTTGDSKLLKEAASGDAQSQYMLGQRYENFEWLGDFRYVWANFWYERAATQRDADALFNLAVSYLMGRGYDANEDNAFILFMASAKLGNVRAIGNLSSILLDEDSAYYDVAQGWGLLEVAAEKGHKYSQYALGMHLIQGDIVNKDYDQAVYWIEKAADQGLQQAIDLLDQIR